jgi:hypothetical protein
LATVNRDRSGEQRLTSADHLDANKLNDGLIVFCKYFSLSSNKSIETAQIVTFAGVAIAEIVMCDRIKNP